MDETQLLQEFTPARIAQLRRRLLRWYERHGRSLPWRNSHDPYRVWISEIMLQQTTVTAVIPYFDRFLARFPTVSHLAAAREQDVLRLWEGLGYYSRGRNLHKAAQIICQVHGGRLPADLVTLQQLPGIGRYTAGAIVSFAFDKPAPIVEANTERLYARLLGYDGDVKSSSGRRLLWAFAESLQTGRGSGMLNQSLIELGSQVCTPSAPACHRCPLCTCCQAYGSGTQSQVPRPVTRDEVVPIVEASVAVHRNGRYLLRKRAADERWAGLWDFPRFELSHLPHRGQLGRRDLESAVRQIEEHFHGMFGGTLVAGDLIREIRHCVTRYRIRLLCFHAEVECRRSCRGHDLAWVRPARLADYPLSVTGRKLAETLMRRAAGKLLR